MKKKIVEVDEDVLKDIIVGDIPVFGKDSPAPKEKSVEHQEAKSPWSIYPRQTVPMCISTVKWPSASNGYCLSSLRR